MNISIPAPLHELLVKLGIIGMIEPGKKLNVNTMTFSDSTSWLGSFTRSVNGESRKNLMTHLNNIIQQTIAAINEYRETEFCKLIVNKLAQAKLGIQALQNTYQSDPHIKSQIEVILTNVDIQLNVYRSLLDGHAKPTEDVK